MITVWGGQTSRSIRVVWLLEEMGLPYRVRHVDMLAAEQNPEFLAINPANYIPAIQDGSVAMVESIAIIEYLMARYGPTPLAPGPNEPTFPAYQQFLHLGEAGLATLMMPVVVSRFMAPAAERENWGATWCLKAFQKRLQLVSQRLASSPYLAGEDFTAADISVTYAPEPRPETLRHHPGRRRTGLPRPHHQPRRLQARHAALARRGRLLKLRLRRLRQEKAAICLRHDLDCSVGPCQVDPVNPHSHAPTAMLCFWRCAKGSRWRRAAAPSVNWRRLRPPAPTCATGRVWGKLAS